MTVAAAPPVNTPPTPVFTSASTFLDAVFDATGSTDAEGPISSYAWTFGDSATGTGSAPTHSYAAAGTYPVTLTVTDSGGISRAVSHPVTVAAAPPVNTAPTAAFTATPSALDVSVDGSASADLEAAIASYAWTFGDGATGTGVTTSHSFASAGTYDISLTVTDAGGLTATVTRQVTVIAAPPVNTPPTAAFTANVADLTAGFDAAGSSDAEGQIASYTWAYGDGTSGSGATSQHVYGLPGTYSVMLSVTDAGGLTGSASRSVTVTAPALAVRASDDFARNVVNGWGSADAGGAWTLSGTASGFAVAAGVGTVRVAAGSGPTAILRSVSSTDTDMAMTLSPDRLATGSGLYLSVVGRRVPTAGDYRAKLRLLADGSMSLLVQRVTTGFVETSLSSTVVPGLTYAAGTQLRVRLLVTGIAPTTVRAKVWKVGSPEPSWQVSGTDATAIFQGPGQLGLVTYLSSTATSAITVSVDALDARASTV